MGEASDLDLRSRLRGMLLAGACGDALGAPIEFLPLAEIRKDHGSDGPGTYVEGGWPAGSITDDTQMTLFTAEGIIRAVVRAAGGEVLEPMPAVHRAYLRWLRTQGGALEPADASPDEPDGWLFQQSFLQDQRVPGSTCIGALIASRGEPGKPAINDSKGCGSVMRTAPAALWDLSRHGLDAFDEGCAYAAVTHAHPTGYIAAGFQSRVLALLLQGLPPREAIERACVRLRETPKHEETLVSVEAALALAGEGAGTAERVERLGQGWIADEALAIGLYAALVAPDVRSGLRLAVTHGGDSDSTGAIAGNLLGAIHGEEAIPADLLEPLEGREVIARVADDLLRIVIESPGDLAPEDLERYPGW